LTNCKVCTKVDDCTDCSDPYYAKSNKCEKCANEAKACADSTGNNTKCKDDNEWYIDTHVCT